MNPGQWVIVAGFLTVILATGYIAFTYLIIGGNAAVYVMAGFYGLVSIWATYIFTGILSYFTVDTSKGVVV